MAKGTLWGTLLIQYLVSGSCQTSWFSLCSNFQKELQSGIRDKVAQMSGWHLVCIVLCRSPHLDARLNSRPDHYWL